MEEVEIKKIQAENEKLKAESEKLKAENAQLNKDLEESTRAATEAIENYNKIRPLVPKNYEVVLDKKTTVIVNFGVIIDGVFVSRDELLDKPEAIKSLLKKKSSAVTIKEG